jgi:hypothetical protein
MPMTLAALMQGPLPVTAPLVLNPLMARMVALEANLNLTEICQAALERATVEKARTS